MDPESLRELQDSISQLNSVLASQTSALAGMAQSLNIASNTLNQNTDATKKNTDANKNTTGIDRIADSNKKAAEIAAQKSAEIEKGLTGAGGALNSFTQAVLSNQAGFEKYGSTVSGLGKAAWDIGKNFGILGKFIGGLGFAIGKVTEAGFKQADGLLKGVDALSDIGAAGQLTSDEMYKMGHKMGLNSQNLEIFTKAATSARTSMIGLGNTAGDGIKEFANLTAVTQKQRNAFQRLGVSQEELMQRQADYIQLQLKSGQAISKRDLADGTVARQSLQYAKDLSVISAITGRNAKEAAEGEERARASVNVQIHQRKLQMQIDDPKTSAELREKLQKKLLVENQMLNAAEQTNDPALLAAAQARVATGAITTASAPLVRMGVDFDKIQQEGEKKTLKQLQDEGVAGEAHAALTKAMRDGIQNNVKNLGSALVHNEDTAKQYGVTVQSMAFAAGQSTKDAAAVNKAARDAVGKPEDGKTNKKVDEDPAQVARNNLTNMEIAAKQKMDDLVKSMNPLLGNMGALKLLAIAAAGVAAIMVAQAASGGIGSLKDGLGNLFKKGSKVGKLAEAAEGAEGAAGAAEGAVAAEGGLAAEGAVAAEGAAGAAAGGGLLAAGGLALGGLAVGWLGNKAADKLKESGHEKIGAGVSVGSDAASGALIGAAVGSIVPGLGTAIGAGVGGLIGAGYGVYKNWGVIGGQSKESKEQEEVKKRAKQLEDIKALSKQLTAFQAIPLHKDKIKNNADAVVSFSKAMSEAAGFQQLGAASNAAASVANTIARGFEKKTPLDKLEEFAKPTINVKKVKNNAEGFVAFSQAMSSYKGMGSGLGDISHSIAMAITKSFDAKPPVKEFAYFASLPIDPHKAKENSQAFVAFANAMAEYKGGPGLGDAISSLVGKGFNMLFGQDSPVEAFVKFTKQDFGPNAAKNADAFYKYAQAATKLSSGGGGGGGTPPSGGDRGGGLSESFSSGMSAGSRAAGAAAGAVSSGASYLGSLASSAWSSATNFGKSIYNKFIGKTDGVDSNTLQKFGKVQGALGNKSIYVTSGARPAGWITPKGTISSKSNPHVVKRALDLGITGDQTAVVQAAIKAGFTGIGGEGNHIHIDDSHPQLTLWGTDYTGASTPGWLKKAASMKAKDGGIFGNAVDEPAMPSGKKLAPLQLDSLLMKLAKTNADSLNQAKALANTPNHAAEDQGAMNLELYNMIQHKLDYVLSALDNSHSTQSKILKHSMV
jgi:hypothetical protein